MSDFTNRLREILDDVGFARANELTEGYWTSFTGRYFEQTYDRNRPNEITANDIVAVSMLSVDIPPEVSHWLLNDGRDEISALLSEIPTNLDIWDADSLLDDAGSSPLYGLWRTISGHDGMGPTKTSKLLAAKRPHLVPVQDRVVVSLMPAVPNWWRAWATALKDPELRLFLSIAAGGGIVESQAGLLRRVDALLWRVGTLQSV